MTVEVDQAGTLRHVGDVKVERAVGVDRFVVAGTEVTDRFVADAVSVGSLRGDRVFEVAGGGEDAEALTTRLWQCACVVCRRGGGSGLCRGGRRRPGATARRV
jgi:hypothetical protein